MFDRGVKGQKGFTLVELALVLVIIGLLITGVLKGEALIQNAKVKKVVNQKESLTAAFYAFYDKYNQYPGDTNVAPTGSAYTGNGNGQVTGNERWYLFDHLVRASIINGSYNGTANSVPVNAYGSWMRIEYIGAITANCVSINAIPYDVAEELDRKYDDGVYNTGSIRSNTDYANQAAKLIYWRM